MIFLSIGPLNAAMANVLPAALRGQGFAVNMLAIHLLGDAISPYFIGLASDRIGASSGRCSARARCWCWPAWCCSRAAARSTRDLARVA